MLYNPAVALAPLMRPFNAGPIVVAQLGQTLDGRIATITGASKYISGREALVHLHRLRACVDAVVVGVGTVVADDPQLTVRLAPGRNPVRVVIDPKGRAPHGASVFRDGAAPTLSLAGPDAPPPPEGVERIFTPLGPGGVIRPEVVVARLAARGLRRILIEGGAHTIGLFLDAGRIDLLHLLVAPMILGSGKPGISLRPIEQLSDALRPATRVHAFPDGDVLFTCDLRAQLAAAE